MSKKEIDNNMCGCLKGLQRADGKVTQVICESMNPIFPVTMIIALNIKVKRSIFSSKEILTIKLPTDMLFYFKNLICRAYFS